MTYPRRMDPSTPLCAARANAADRTVDGRGFLYSKNFERPCVSLLSQVLANPSFGSNSVIWLGVFICLNDK